MSKHFSMGAINKITDSYEHPKIASNKLVCNSCQKPKCKCVRITDFFKI